MTRTYKFLTAILLACAAATAARAQAPEAGRPTAVKALLIGLTNDDKIGKGVAMDLQLVEGYVRGLPGFDADRDLRKLSGSDVTADNIRQAVEDLEVAPTDVLFCYYAGHGAYDPNLDGDDPSGGHFFQIPGGDLRRSDLRDWLEAKGARLTVLITDTCNAAGDFDESREEDAGDPNATTDPAADAEPVVSKALETLLFDFTGVVDVNGASRDQFGLAGDDGSLSTIGLLKALDEESQSLTNALSQVAPLDWDRFLQDASEDIHGVFEKTKEAIQTQPEPDDEDARDARQQVLDQNDLRPQAFRLDVQPAEAGQDGEDLTPAADGGPAVDDLLAPAK
jgi:hypothetical protein